MVTTILMDGDFLNYDFELHKDAKYANQSEYDHGPYGEGSIRHRRMYTYPNPLNYFSICGTYLLSNSMNWHPLLDDGHPVRI